jgi:hypothetical protein
MGFWIRTSNFVFFIVNGLIKGRLRNQVISSLVWLWWVIDLTRFKFESGTFWFLPLSLFRVENRVYLSRGVLQVAGVAWRAATRIMVGVGDLVRRTGDSQAHVGYSVAGWSGGRVTPCAVCTMHVESEFLGWASKPRSTIYKWFGLKTTRTILSGLASKPVAIISPGLVSKLVADFLFEPQNQDSGGFFELCLITGRYGLIICASKSP